MNYFIIVAGFLYMFGAVREMAFGDWKLGVIFFCYAIANYMLAIK